AYRWNKIGYCETTVGAMEHATNIAYPYFIVNGQTTYENIMAHELAHNWFGNLVTCRKAEDMWLNEGWAEYGSYVFYEKVYGKEKYNTTVAANHESVVHYAHTTIKDGAYYAVGNVPETKTYGTTVYYKGADMAHTLRGYMGDSLFFSCIKNYLDAFAFKDASSYNFRDYLTSCSGIDLTNFFDDWIFQPGWAVFTIDSFNVEEGQPGVFNTNVFLRQRLDHAQNFYNEVPLELSFYDEERNVTTETAFISGNCAEFSITLPFSPVYVGLDLDEKISDAQTADLKTIKNIGAINFVNGKMNLTVNSISDSVLLRIEHVYAAPDPFVYPIPKLHISQERFWKVDGIIPDGFDATSIISYSGATTTGGFLDNNLITNSEDSMVLLYKEIPAHDWQIETDAVQNVLVSHSDKKGNFTINHLKKGYYTFGIYQNNKIDSVINFGNYPCQVVGVPAIPFSNKMELNVFPNPADESITIEIGNTKENNLLEIYNLYGMRVFSSTLRSKQQILSVKNWHRGTYLLKISDHNNRQVAAQIFIVN
ncbi:MAG: T9SS type A sorting domain-containing protein, partial [Chitinophagales bacterium]|nr:T9SS type A sorting domain-containing protein [Chitinophagales bacterium]